ncbi:MAG: two-component system, OmpR family, sensor kinase [Gaiellaceae bacterium]|nr:two-component system, OmpR family, sensor kinase [Gaiellaceae bacterium]
MPGQLSLRARLILGVIALATVGLVAADFATYHELRSFLLNRTDASLQSAHISAEQALLPHDHHTGGNGSPTDDTQGSGESDLQPLPGTVPGEYLALRLLDGTTVRVSSTPSRPGGDREPPPSLPSQIALPAANHEGDRVRYFTVAAKSGGERYRVRASIESAAKNYMLIVAQPLGEVDSTLHRLLLVALLVTALVLAAIAALGLWVVRLGLKPLEAIGATASKIAAGDLTQRVRREDEGTEVGRLGLALNAMLGQIEAAAIEREESLRALEASERKLRRFVADASHELRTPLAAVRAYAELFTRGAAERPADLERSMSGISRESERMTVLVDDLLLLARLDEGRPLTLKPVQLDEVVAEALETAHMVDPARPIDADLDPVSVLGDRDRLRQVVDNLLANVRAHTPATAPAQVQVEQVDGMARIEVKDSGPGMAAEQSEHVFERFYRADQSRSRASGGAGLGLSIVAAVTEAHGGRVSVVSTPGSGATFRVEIPLAD